MEKARRSGVGLHVHEWSVQAAEAPQMIVDWCRQTMGAARRPWGINHFDLTIVARGEPGALRRQFTRLDPATLYDGAFLALMAHLLADMADGELNLAVALCSWGDLAYEVLVRPELATS
jgi:hypothetical protein